MADHNPTPDVDEAMAQAERDEVKARKECEDRLRAHNERVLASHRANAQVQAALADRAVEMVPVAVDAGVTWWQTYRHLVLAGFGGAASLWALEWSAHKVRQTLRGRR